MPTRITRPREATILGLAFAFGLSGFGCGSNSSTVTTTTTTPVAARFAATGNLSTRRVQHTATLLNNGMVLVAGGTSNTPSQVANPTALATAELYNPQTGSFTATGSMQTARLQHTATLLSNGMVLIAGGEDSLSHVLSSAELYNPDTGTFSATGSLMTARDYHTATLLSNGMVLIAGGRIPTFGSSFQGIASAELYDPASGTFTATGNLNTARLSHTATLLNNGTVLVAGGYTHGIGTAVFASAELYNPQTGTFSTTGSMSTPREFLSATILTNGMVLVTGGDSSDVGSTVLASAELYNPSSATFSPTGNMTAAREAHSLTLLSNGTVLVAGGGSTSALSSAEIYSSSTGTFAATASLNAGRGLHTATLLKNGDTLVAGGEDSAGNVLASAELFEPASGQ